VLHRTTVADQLGQVLQASVAVDDAEADLERSKPDARSCKTHVHLHQQFVSRAESLPCGLADESMRGKLGGARSACRY